MPKVALTQAQKEQSSNERRRQLIADGLAAYKNRNHLSNEALGRGLGIGRNTVERILSAESVKLDTDKHFKVLAASGYTMRRATDEMDA